jgi:hypothetical protein
MQKRLALFILALIVVLSLVPAYCPPDDEALSRTSQFSDISAAPATIAAFSLDIDRHHAWPGIFVSLDIFYSLPQDVISPSGARAPPV